MKLIILYHFFILHVISHVDGQIRETWKNEAIEDILSSHPLCTVVFFSSLQPTWVDQHSVISISPSQKQNETVEKMGNIITLKSFCLIMISEEDISQEIIPMAEELASKVTSKLLIVLCDDSFCSQNAQISGILANSMVKVHPTKPGMIWIIVFIFLKNYL
jgi:hypothetical protein